MRGCLGPGTRRARPAAACARRRPWAAYGRGRRGGVLTDEPFERDAWERRWGHVLREHPDKVASRPPNEHLLAETRGLWPGLALDAGCGHRAPQHLVRHLTLTRARVGRTVDERAAGGERRWWSGDGWTYQRALAVAQPPRPDPPVPPQPEDLTTGPADPHPRPHGPRHRPAHSTWIRTDLSDLIRDRPAPGVKSAAVGLHGQPLACRGRLDGHRGRLLPGRARARPVDRPGRGRRRGRAHRMGRERPRELDPTVPALRPRRLPVRPRDRVRGRAGRPARFRRHARRDDAPGRPPARGPPDRQADARRGPCAGVDGRGHRGTGCTRVGHPRGGGRFRAAAGAGVDAVVRAVRRP